eukprot:614768-Pyramimonas_sp.AAC.1
MRCLGAPLEKRYAVGPRYKIEVGPSPSGSPLFVTGTVWAHRSRDDMQSDRGIRPRSVRGGRPRALR